MTRSVRRYIAGLSVVFWGLVFVAAVMGVGLPPHPILAVAPLAGLAIAAEALVVGRKDSSASFSVAAHVAAAILFGPLAAALVAALGVVLVDGLRLGPRPPVFLNSAIFGLSAAAGGCAFLAAGGSVGPLTERDVVPAMALVGVRFVANEVLLAVAISLNSGIAMARQLRDDLRDLAGAAIGEGCLGVLVAFGLTGRHWLVLPFLVPLLVALYQAQLNFERLKRETAAALSTFAGVIDERDPNTASHSARVAEYVERFAAAVQLPDREATRLVEAARYHDLGKVVVDESTLSRPGRLSEEELRKIRSHPALSARLLSPFHFAQEMALYAELHHERYDGSGYYHVPQREIPVEAHVLIAADSFDAMTSTRAYRPALTVEEAVRELRDKAGSQFHPLVAQAFAAMIEERDLEIAMGATQLAALRAEFSRVATIRLPAAASFIQPRVMTVYLASATAIALGVRTTPLTVRFGLASAMVCAAVAAIRIGLAERRRRKLALLCLERGSSAAGALKAAGVRGWVAWLSWDEIGQSYSVEGETPTPQDVEDLLRRAARVGAPGRAAVLESGLHYSISPPVAGGRRLAVWTRTGLTQFETVLLSSIAERADPSAPVEAVLTALPGDRRAIRREGTEHSLIVKLGAFDDVRSVAGQLSAERVVADAATRLQGAIRQGDSCRQVGDDAFEVTVSVSQASELGAVSNRIRAALDEVSVPSRARPIRTQVSELSDDARHAV